ncbi:DUF523 and DUF1722 domain-containing protein [Clostridium sp.]|uniref:YbgA family protein n=1 Tax=Clostridium sp. TaxID=1506 RepID=UPI0026174F5D
MKTYWPKPILIISKCLGNTPCRYNGETTHYKFIDKLKNYCTIIEVCPEEGIGLPTPRNAIRLISSNNNSVNLIDPKTLKDYTKNMCEFANEMCVEYKTLSPHAFLLKGRSPSCGIQGVKIYKGTEKGASSKKGKGIFANEILKRFPNTPIEEEGRLNNFHIREHFLIRLFLFAKFDEIKNTKKINDLINFHSTNKLLFMSYNQAGLKILGNIVANHKHKKINEILNEYYTHLILLLKKQPKYTSLINTYNHAFGYFSKNLLKNEKEFFLDTLNKFKLGKVPRSVITSLLKSYAIRFNNKYLLSQSILEPYPEALLDISDSGKGIVRD